MGVEERAARRAAPGLRVARTGIGLAGGPVEHAELGISVGLAGGLLDSLEPGTVVVADRVTATSGETVVCDPRWVEALGDAAAALGVPHVVGSLFTAGGIVAGAERSRRAAEGHIAADMESGVLAAHLDSIAVARTILDTPRHEISPAWAHPSRAARDPRLWRQGAWLAWWAGRYAARSARVAAEAHRRLSRRV
ncbi:MAG: hypothetical protein JOY68_00100 [Candidatus Dormibacteraeota bacterium]|nr:hypothetical protein [Candidatus Dormibacteraeota bacterium]